MTSSLKLYYSGGRMNYSADQSIGGTRSTTEIGSEKNNLFDDVLGVDALDGKTDFRCIFLRNESTSPLKNCSIRLSEQTAGEDEISIHVEKDLPIEIDALDFNQDLQLFEGISQTLDLRTKGISVLSFKKGREIGNPQDSLKVQICDLEFNPLFETLISSADWSTVLEGDEVRLPIDLEIPAQTNLMLHFSRTGPIDYDNDYSLKISSIFHYFGGSLKSKRGGIWLSQVGNLSFQIRGYSDSPQFSDWVFEDQVEEILPNESLPIWIRRVIPAGCKPVETNKFRLKIQGEFDG